MRSGQRNARQRDGARRISGGFGRASGSLPTSPGRAIPVSTHETAEEAFGKVIDLMTHGMVNVRIVDDAGRQFTTTEFVREMDGLPNETEFSPRR